MRPRQVRYQAALRPDSSASLILNHFPRPWRVGSVPEPDVSQPSRFEQTLDPEPAAAQWPL